MSKKSLSSGDGFAEYSQEDMQYAQKLSEMIQYKTIAVDAGGEQLQFDEYRKKLGTLFPTFFSRVDEIDIPGAYLWRIAGSSKKDPALILAHSDVVDAPGEWEYPPFSGTIKDGMVHGRGAIDNKGMLSSALCAMERLLNENFEPKNDIYIVSTQNEESTSAGILQCREYFERNGLFFSSILDEGGVVTCDVMPGIKNDMAIIGLCEKGYIDMRFTAKSSGGHSGSPGKGNPLARLSGFINYIETHSVFKTKTLPTVRGMFEAVSPHMSFPFRLLLGNFWLYGALLKILLPRMNPSIGAMLKTTIVFTRCEGSTSNNVIPVKASATANIRNLPGESCKKVIDKLSYLAKKYDLETEVLYQKDPSSETSVKSDAVKALFDVVKQVFPATVVAPYMAITATDCCRLDGLSDNIFRFSPLRSTGEEIAAMHGDNERVGIAQLGRAVEFFYVYLQLNLPQIRFFHKQTQ
jgi:carboxypeptidase PM20D1